MVGKLAEFLYHVFLGVRIFVRADVHALAYEYGILSLEILLEQGVGKFIRLRFEEVKMVHAILLAADFRFVVGKGERVGGDVYLRYDFYKLGCRLVLEVDKLLLGVKAVAGSQSGISVRLQTEGGICLVPVVTEKLLEAVVVEVHLQGVHLIISHDFHQVLQIRHRDKFPTTVYHESTDRIVGVIADDSLGQLMVGSLFRNLQKGACAPVKSGRSGGGERHTVGYFDGISFFS